MKDHIFDILGISNREDSYTDLIAYSFTTSSSFRKNILDILEIPDYGDWITRTRLPVAIKSNTGRKKDVPDLLLISKKGNKIALIEGKIHSSEGWEQTRRYSSDEFKESLIHYLHKNELLESKAINIKFFYLTLDGDKPSSNEFNILKYSDIANCIPSNLEASKRDILLQELLERIEEYYNWQPPSNNEIVIEYLKKAERLVTPYKAFCVMANAIDNPKDEFITDFCLTGNRGSSYIPLCQWFKSSWRGTNCNEIESGSRCHEIYINLQWDTLWNTFNLYLDYHTCPYMTQKDLKNRDTKFIMEYKETRDEFFDYVKERSVDDWVMKKAPLRIANATFDKNITFSELKNRVKDLTLGMAEVIDEWVVLNK